jgi:MBG domain (YGX type)/Bacterial Ig-like domain (group 3)
VPRRSTTTSINAPAVSYNAAGNVTVTVTSASRTPTGNVSLMVDGAAPVTVALSNGSAAFTFNGLNAGDHSLTARYAGQGDFEFAASSSTGTLHVNPLPITVAADAKAKTYGDSDPALTYQVTSGALVNGDTFTGSLRRVAGNNVGTYALAPGTLSAGPNYTMTFVAASLTINRKSASVRPNAAGKIYGSGDPVLTGTLSGFLSSDNVTGIFTRAAGEAVGSYTINAAAGPANVLSNYDVTYNTASFLIAPLAVSVTPNPASKTFGDSDPNPLTTGTLNGFLARDNVTASYSRAAGESPGQYTISATLTPAAVLSNYTITYDTANFTIRKYMVSVCDGNGRCSGGSKANDNGIGSRLTITSPALLEGNATATVTLSPATVNGKDTLMSPGVGDNNQPLPPVMTVWLAAVSDPTHPVLFGTGTATRVGPDANGNRAWQTSITARLNLPAPGEYTAYVYGDDASSRTQSQVQNGAGYSNGDTTHFIYPSLTAPLTVTGRSTTTSP